MRAPSPTSRLDLALLGLLHHGPRSGYDLRKAFATTPLIRFSDSPGAIYPALGRLERLRLVRGVREPGSRRHKRLFEPTAAGRRHFRAWLLRPVSRAEVSQELDQVMLRFVFLAEHAARRHLVRFLEGLRLELGTYRAELTSYVRRGASREMSLAARLALANGLEGYAAQERWAARTLARFKREARRT